MNKTYNYVIKILIDGNIYFAPFSLWLFYRNNLFVDASTALSPPAKVLGLIREVKRIQIQMQPTEKQVEVQTYNMTILSLCFPYQRNKVHYAGMVKWGDQ